MEAMNRLLSLFKEWGDLGWAIQAQLQSVADGDDVADQNRNALAMILGFLSSVKAEDDLFSEDLLIDLDDLVAEIKGGIKEATV